MAGKWIRVKSNGEYDIEEERPCSGGLCFRVKGPGIFGSGLCRDLEEAEDMIGQARRNQENNCPDDDSDDEPSFRR